MKNLTRLATLGLLLLGACATNAPQADDSAAVGREWTRAMIAKGTDAIPELQAALESEDAAVRYQARSAMGAITGQWGSKGDLIWKRSVADAKNDERPLVVLHLFGNLDEEFC